MTDIAGLTYYELDFNADGTLSSDGGLPAAVQGGGIQDVYVLSHGWNNGVNSARNLYQAMFTLLAGMIPGKLGSSCAVGVIWPSLLFPNDDPATAQPIPLNGPADSRRYRAGVPGAAAERCYARPATGPAAAGPRRAGAVPHAGVQPGHYSPARVRGLRSGGRHHL